jgi:hypothetical protein
MRRTALGWGAAAVASLAALVLAPPDADPPAAAADRGAAAPTPVLQMMGLAAATVAAPSGPDDTAPALQPWLDRREFAAAVLALQRSALDVATRERLLQDVLARWAEAAPEQAARWALHTPGQATLLAPLHDRWLQHDARSAAVFASTLPSGEPRQALLDEALLRWTAQDGAGARDWLRSYAPRADLDQAIARHAASDELARRAPAEAMDLVARIASPERRWQAWQTLAQHLRDIDAAQAATLLSQAPGLRADERARLLGGVP